VNCPNEPLHKKFLGCPMPQVCWNFCPKTQTALIPPPPFPPPTHPPTQDFSLHYYFFTWWLFEAWEESFQNSNYPLNQISTYWEPIQRFWVHRSYFLYIHFYEWCGFEVNLMEWKSIHENSWKMKFILKISLMIWFHPWSTVHSDFFFSYKKCKLFLLMHLIALLIFVSLMYIYQLGCHCFCWNCQIKNCNNVIPGLVWC